MKKTNEPPQLIRGKLFHKKIQRNWKQTAEGDVATERTVIKQNLRKGRVDIFVNDDDPDGCIAIVEIKASNWDIMTDRNVLRNIRRQIRQIYGYLDTQILNGVYVDSGEKKSVSLGIIFPKKPFNEHRKVLIENLFFEEGIVVVWDEINSFSYLSSPFQ